MKRILIIGLSAFLVFALLISCSQEPVIEGLPEPSSIVNEKPSQELTADLSTPEPTKSAMPSEELLKEYFVSVLIPEFGISQIKENNTPVSKELEGVLSYYITDLDEDNIDELLTITLEEIEETTKSDEYSLATEKYRLAYNLYGVDNENVVLLDSFVLPQDKTVGFYLDDYLKKIKGEYALDVVVVLHEGKTYLVTAGYYGYGYETSSLHYTIYEFENKKIVQKYIYENNATIDYEDYAILKNGEPIFEGVIDNSDGYTILENELNSFGIDDTVFFSNNPEGKNSDTITHLARIWSNIESGDYGWKVVDYTDVKAMTTDVPPTEQKDKENEVGNIVNVGADAVTLKGRLEKVTEMRETRDGEEEITFYVLKLNLPTDFVFEEFLDNESENDNFGEGIMRDITEIHTTFNMHAKEVEQYLGKSVTILGNAFQAHTQYHFRPIVMIDCVIEK